MRLFWFSYVDCSQTHGTVALCACWRALFEYVCERMCVYRCCTEATFFKWPQCLSVFHFNSIIFPIAISFNYAAATILCSCSACVVLFTMYRSISFRLCTHEFKHVIRVSLKSATYRCSQISDISLLTVLCTIVRCVVPLFCHARTQTRYTHTHSVVIIHNW